MVDTCGRFNRLHAGCPLFFRISGLLAQSGFPARDFPDRQRRIELDLGPISAA
jgi:hypothetical protein